MTMENEKYKLNEDKKKIFVDHMMALFRSMRYMMDTIEEHIHSEDEEVEARAGLLGANLFLCFNEYLEEMKILTQSQAHWKKE